MSIYITRFHLCVIKFILSNFSTYLRSEVEFTVLIRFWGLCMPNRFAKIMIANRYFIITFAMTWPSCFTDSQYVEFQSLHFGLNIMHPFRFIHGSHVPCINFQLVYLHSFVLRCPPGNPIRELSTPENLVLNIAIMIYIKDIHRSLMQQFPLACYILMPLIVLPIAPPLRPISQSQNKRVPSLYQFFHPKLLTSWRLITYTGDYSVPTCICVIQEEVQGRIFPSLRLGPKRPNPSKA